MSTAKKMIASGPDHNSSRLARMARPNSNVPIEDKVTTFAIGGVKRCGARSHLM